MTNKVAVYRKIFGEAREYLLSFDCIDNKMGLLDEWQLITARVIELSSASRLFQHLIFFPSFLTYKNLIISFHNSIQMNILVLLFRFCLKRKYLD